jgi:hypothetical protein
MNHPNRRQFLQAAGAVACGTVAGSLQRCLGTARSEKHARPNVRRIMTDDQGWGDIHSHGNDKIDAAVLDGLA